jgi:hypothetical protein
MLSGLDASRSRNAGSVSSSTGRWCSPRFKRVRLCEGHERRAVESKFDHGAVRYAHTMGKAAATTICTRLSTALAPAQYCQVVRTSVTYRGMSWH